MGLRGLVYRIYEHRLEASLSPQAIPRHVGVLVDGNRRWARSAGLSDVSSTGVQITMEFKDFDDLWSPFLGGTGTAPAYVATLEDGARERLRAELERMVHPDQDGRIRMPARAWAVRGRAA